MPQINRRRTTLTEEFDTSAGRGLRNRKWAAAERRQRSIPTNLPTRNTKIIRLEWGVTETSINPKAKIWRRSRAREQERNEPRATATTVPRSFAKIVGTNRVRERDVTESRENHRTEKQAWRCCAVKGARECWTGKETPHRTTTSFRIWCSHDCVLKILPYSFGG